MICAVRPLRAMADDPNRIRMEAAIGNASPFEALHALAKSFKAEGMSQRAMYDLFASYHSSPHDCDELKSDALADVMDFICGWCTPDKRLFQTEL